MFIEFETRRERCFRNFFFFSSRRRHTRSYGDWSSDVCSSDLSGAVRSLMALPTSFLGVLRKLVGSAIKLRTAPEEKTAPEFAPRLLGSSPTMEQLREMIVRVARSQAPVHICGESGTGKELAARMIHETGARREGPFVAVNCGAIPTELMESEL